MVQQPPSRSPSPPTDRYELSNEELIARDIDEMNEWTVNFDSTYFDQTYYNMALCNGCSNLLPAMPCAYCPNGYCDDCVPAHLISNHPAEVRAWEAIQKQSCCDEVDSPSTTRRCGCTTRLCYHKIIIEKIDNIQKKQECARCECHVLALYSCCVDECSKQVDNMELWCEVCARLHDEEQHFEDKEECSDPVCMRFIGKRDAGKPSFFLPDDEIEYDWSYCCNCESTTGIGYRCAIANCKARVNFCYECVKGHERSVHRKADGEYPVKSAVFSLFTLFRNDEDKL